MVDSGAILSVDETILHHSISGIMCSEQQMAAFHLVCSDAPVQ